MAGTRQFLGARAEVVTADEVDVEIFVDLVECAASSWDATSG